MLKFTKEDGERIASLQGKVNTNERLRAHYGSNAQRDKAVLQAFCAELEKTTSFGYIPSEKVSTVYEPAITAMTKADTTRRNEHQKLVEAARTELAPFMQTISAEIDAIEKRATVRSLNAADVTSAIYELQAGGKRGDTKTITTMEKLPKSYKYPQSYTVAKITRRKSDGAFTIEITREMSF